jgi:hypothetical protein
VSISMVYLTNHKFFFLQNYALYKNYFYFCFRSRGKVEIEGEGGGDGEDDCRNCN